MEQDLDRKMQNYYSNAREYFEHIRQNHNSVYFDALIRTLRHERISIAGKKVLDLGSGTGEILSVLKQTFGDSFTAFGTDISFIGCQMQQHGSPVNADAKQLPFGDGSFDLVILSDVLEHIPSPHKALMEAHRVAKRGGYVLLRTPNYRCPPLGQYTWRRLDRCFADVISERPRTLADTPILNPVLGVTDIGGDADACSAIMADALRRTCQELGGDPLVYETWAGLGWRIPALRIFNRVPLLRHIGGTCTVLYRKEQEYPPMLHQYKCTAQRNS